MIFVQAIVALLLFLVGRRSPAFVVGAVVATYPYLGTNGLGSIVVPPFAPAISAAFACIALAYGRVSESPDRVQRLWRNSLWLCGYICAITFLGVLTVNASHLTSWAQSPMERAVRATLGECVIWMLPASILVLCDTRKRAISLIRVAVIAGAVYCALGLVQFAASIVLDTDIFPAIRPNGLVQPLALDGLMGRITSLCGEPRYLSAFCVMWFALLLFSKRLVGFSVWSFRALLMLFIVSNFLTGSRTGVVALAITAVLAMFVAPTENGRRSTWRRFAPLAIVAGSLAAFLQFADTSLATRVIDPDETQFITTIDVFGQRVPLEWQDAAFLTQSFASVPRAAFGYGSGMVQYELDPFEDEKTFAVYAKNEGALDSPKPNFGFIFRLSSFGLLGLWFMGAWYVTVVKKMRVGAPPADAKDMASYAIFTVVLLHFIRLNEPLGQALFALLVAALAIHRGEIAAPEDLPQMLGEA